MSFLLPAMLAGLAAVGIPIAIHLLNKFRVKKTTWAAFQFLADSLRKNERRLRTEDLILLIVRCLLVALLALAFARPVLRSLIVSGEDATGPVAAVVLLDNSASMAQSDGVATRFARAKELTREWLDRRESGSIAALWLVSDRVEPLIESPSADVALFRKMLDSSQTSERGSDLAQGVRAAYQTLVNISGRPLEIRVYSDDQTAAWRGLAEVRKLAAEHPAVHLRHVSVSGAGEANLGVTDLRAEGGVAAVKSPCRVRAQIANYSPQPAAQVRVTLTLDGAGVADEKVIPQIEAGGSAFVDFVVTFTASGWHTLTVGIPPDALPVDNHRSLALNVTARMKAVIAEGLAAGEDRSDRDGYFLANALVPLPRDQAALYYLETSLIPAAKLDTQTLAGARAVFLANPGTLAPATVSALKTYVENGGGLVVFPGPLTDADKWNRTLGELLPATLAAAKDADGDAPLSWQPSDFEHPVTALWNDPAQGTLGAVKCARYFPLTLKPGARTVASLADNTPCVAEWTLGKGRVILFNSTATPEWNNLPLHPAFVPLMQRVLGYASQRDETRLALRPGEPFVITLPDPYAGREFSVQAPNATTREPAGQIAADNDRQTARYLLTEKTGAYRVFIGEEEIAAFAVQLDPDESDLRPLPADELTALTAPQTAADRGAKKRETLTVTKEFWKPIMWIVALLAVVEIALAHWFSREK